MWSWCCLTSGLCAARFYPACIWRLRRFAWRTVPPRPLQRPPRVSPHSWLSLLAETWSLKRVHCPHSTQEVCKCFGRPQRCDKARQSLHTSSGCGSWFRWEWRSLTSISQALSCLGPSSRRWPRWLCSWLCRRRRWLPCREAGLWSRSPKRD